MNESTSSQALKATHRRLEQLSTMYGALRGDDAKELYSTSIAVTHALIHAQLALAKQQHELHQHLHLQFQSTASELRQLTADLNATENWDERNRRDADLTKLKASFTYLEAQGNLVLMQATHATMELLEVIVDLAMVTVMQCVQASDEHYSEQAITRVTDLILGLIEDAADPTGVLGAIRECLEALRDTLEAREKDATSADQVFERERGFQRLTHLAGHLVERMRLTMGEIQSANANNSTPRPVSFPEAHDAWNRRVRQSLDELLEK